MFVGHFAVALGAKRAAPRIPLSLLVGDLPLWPGGALFGLGLWNSIPATLAVEGLIFAGAVFAYATAFPARGATGRWAFRVLIGLMTIIWATQPWSPPPPSATAIAVVGVSMWLFPLWAAWIERHREKGSA